jgi:hypothetical protein
MDSVRQFITRPTECSKSIDNFLLKFKSGHEEIAKNIYRCKLNEEIPHPPLISPMLKKVTLWKTHVQGQGGKVRKEVVATSEENISP